MICFLDYSNLALGSDEPGWKRVVRGGMMRTVFNQIYCLSNTFQVLYLDFGFEAGRFEMAALLYLGLYGTVRTCGIYRCAESNNIHVTEGVRR